MSGGSRTTAAARTDGLGTTVFTEMTALAVRTGAINLGQGFPDTDGPSAAIEAAVSALRNARVGNRLSWREPTRRADAPTRGRRRGAR